MARQVLYKEHVIKSNPELVAHSGQWKLMQPFSGPTVNDSEAEADIHGIAYGQRITDEKLPGLEMG